MAIKYIPFVRRPYPGIILPPEPVDATPVNIVSSISLPIVITDPVDVSGSNVFADIRDGAGNPLTSTLIGTKQAVDVNIAGGVSVSVGIDYTTDSVTVYGSQGAPLQQAVGSDDLIVTLDGEIIVVNQGTSPWIVSATNLDIRDLVFATDKVDVSGSTVTTTIGGTVAVTQSTSPWVVSLASTTITGTVTVTATNLDIRDLVFATDKVDVSGSAISSTISGNVTVDQGTSPWIVAATNLDIRDLVFATDKVDVSGSVISTTVSGNVTVDQGTSPWVVSATNLDIRDLVFATDKVDVSGSSVTVGGTVAVTQSTSPWVVGATNLDIRDLVFATDKVDVSGSAVSVTSGTIAVSNAFNLEATQLDIRTSVQLIDDPVATISATPLMRVAIFDATDTQITSFGGGTQYTEDVAAAVPPVGTAQILIRQDTPVALVSTDGDNLVRRGTNFGAAFTQILDSSGNFVDTFGGGVQYTEGDVSAAIVGTAAMMEVAGDTLQPIQGTVADGLLVNLGANNDVTVTSGSISATQGTSPWVVSLTSTTITGTVAVTQSTSPWVVSATNLDIRDLVFATDKVDVSGSAITAVVTATDLDIRNLVFATDKVDVSGSSVSVAGNVTVDQGTSPWVVSGTITATTPFPAAAVVTDNFANPTTTSVMSMGMLWDGAAWDRMPGNSTDGVLVNLGANNDVTVTGTVSATQGTSPWVISGTVDITEFPAAAAAADNFANPTTTNIMAMGMVFDGSTWDRQLGNSTDGTLVNLGANNDVTVTSGTITTVTTVTAVTSITNPVTTTETSPTTIFNGLTTVTTAGTRVVLAASTTVKSVTVKALSSNTGRIYVGNSTVDSSNGFQLLAEDSVSMDISNLNTVNIDSSVNGEGVTYIGVN